MHHLMAYLNLHLILLFLLLLLNHLSAQTYRNISLGTTLTPLAQPSSWFSPSGDFAFGFRPLETNVDLFLLAVFFNKIANKTIIWTANGNNPIDNMSKVELTSDGQLSLKDSTGQEIWNPGVRNSSYASMLDTGNFVLSTKLFSVKWQSFDNPTDTILPGQVLNEGSSLYARLMDTDYSRGRFELAMQTDGNLVIYPIAFPTTVRYEPYWRTSTSGSGNRLIFNESGGIYVSFPNNSVYFSVTSAKIAAGEYYQRATIDSDGVFRQYSFSKKELTTGQWAVTGKTEFDICASVYLVTGSGACGFNSYCTVDVQGRANCQCPPHYSFIDPTRKYQGCKPDFATQSCEPGGEKSFDFEEMPNVNWPLGNADQLKPMNETECRANCLKDCFCSMAFFNNDGTCWKKKFPLSNGKTGDNGKALIKYSKYSNSELQTPGLNGKKRKWSTWVLVGSLLLGSSFVLNFVLVIFYLYRRSRLGQPLGSNRIPGSLTLCSFTYKELEEATKGFSEEIGRGAFGVVYKGVLTSEPKITIAVKKLENLVEEAERDFANEVTAISQTHHKNLVRFLGFCKEEAHRLLVFEFMSNGPLNRFLFRDDRPAWTKRVQIALGIAEGLTYLHEQCRTQIIHCDIKPQNILLDDNYVAKISDFGLAKLLHLDQTRTRTCIRGTIGYFAPEWFKHVAITAKVDVHSFGVMLLEIVCCRRSFEWGLESQENVTLIDHAKECFRTGRLDLLVQENDDNTEDDVTKLERFVLVAISCIQDEPWLRPSMKRVVQMLEGSIPVAIPPNMYSVHQ